MDKKTVIRAFRESDLDTICDIAVRAWAPIYETFRKDSCDELFYLMYPDWKAEKAGQIRNKANSRPDQILVTEYDGKIVGFTSYQLNEEKFYGEIGNNAIHPDYQGFGIGKMQHNKLLEIFAQKGMKFAIVTTGLDESHAKARASYEKAGFQAMRSSVTYFQKL